MMCVTLHRLMFHLRRVAFRYSFQSYQGVVESNGLKFQWLGACFTIEIHWRSYSRTIENEPIGLFFLVGLASCPIFVVMFMPSSGVDENLGGIDYPLPQLLNTQADDADL